MAEIAGLALGVVGIAGLFKSCIENFNIVVRAREFSEEFELLCTQLALQQIRLAIWGETLGLVPPPSGRRARPYNRALDRPDIRPAIEDTLNQLRNLLTKADAITGRYSSEEQERAAVSAGSRAISDSKGMSIFRESYQRFKTRMKRNQEEKSVWQVTRWSIFDYERFERLVTNIRALIDALESITSALGVLAQQQSHLIEEIETLSDTSSLHLLQQIGPSGSAPAALRTISDTASARLTLVTSSSRSYHTAKTEQSQKNSAASKYNHLETMLSKARTTGTLRRPQQQANVSNGEVIKTGPPAILETTEDSNAITDIPQHQRWMAALLEGKTANDLEQLAFSAKDLQYGQALRSSKDHDEKICRDNSGKLAAEAHDGVPLARRMFLELRNIRRAEVPFVSAAPVGDRLDKILASVEGPPGTPYEGGIFWIAVKITESKPPILSFHTKIYHPNIDPNGKICADYATWWRDAGLLNGLSWKTHQRALPWFSEHVTNHYSLGSLLVALCGLLASPNIDDPLVPEIAEKYVTDYEAYSEAARLYTRRYAHAERPDDNELIFPDEDNMAGTDAGAGAAEYRWKPTAESIMSRRVVMDEYMVWEQIPTYQLQWTNLETLLSKWFPGVHFIHNDYVHQFCVALPKPLTAAQRQEIHRLRDIEIENGYVDDSSSESSELSDDTLYGLRRRLKPVPRGSKSLKGLNDRIRRLHSHDASSKLSADPVDTGKPEKGKTDKHERSDGEGRYGYSALRNAIKYL